jgi:hypothetical protein
MPEKFEREVKARGGAVRWRNKSLPGGKYLKIAVTREKGPEGGKTVAYEKTKKTSESIERIKALVAEAGHKSGCQCGFCKNKGKIGNWKKDKSAPEEKAAEEEPSEVEEALGPVKLSKGVDLGGPAARRYHGMTSKQAMTPEWKTKTYIDAAAEVTNQKDRQKGFKSKDFGIDTAGGRIRRRESLRPAWIVGQLLES